jgi:predicted transcriptional regulator of viral defense system
MRFREFESIVKDFPLFNLNDIRKFAPDFQRRQLHTWTRNGLLMSIAGGYYVLAEKTIDEEYLFMAANLLYEPSYVSLESALAYYQVIPETVLGVTSISSRRTKQFSSDWGIFHYRSVRSDLLFGYEVVEVNRQKKYKMAKLEKAILDFLYLNSKINQIIELEALRWNKDRIQAELDELLFDTYLEIFNKKSLRVRANLLKDYLNA